MQVGDRVAFDNGLGYEPRWLTGTVYSVRADTAGEGSVRVTWDDGFVDDKVSEWYRPTELAHISGSVEC